VEIVVALDALEILSATFEPQREEYRYTPGTVVGRVEGVLTPRGGRPLRYFRDVTFGFHRVRWEVRDELLTLLAP
jgi:hypothetical protein